MANAPDRYERFMVQEGTLKYAFGFICTGKSREYNTILIL